MTDSVQSVERCFAILSAFGLDETSLTATQIANHADLPRATTYRMLKTLAGLGFVTSTKGRYELTHAVIELGAGYRGPDGIAGHAQRFLDALAASVDEHVALAILPDDRGIEEVVAITVSAPLRSRLLAVAIQPGQRLPARQTAMGRVLLAHHHQLGEQGEAIRTAGYAIADSHLEPGLRAIAVPVFGLDGGPVAALSAACTASRTTLKRLRQEILPELRTTASDLQRASQPR